MAEEPYLRDCPRCGGELEANVSAPTAPPWRCPHCFVSWWVAELAPGARRSFRLAQHDWGSRSSESYKAVRRAVAREQEEAVRRGTSLRREQVGLASPRAIKGLLRLRLPLAPEHEAQLRERIA